MKPAIFSRLDCSSPLAVFAKRAAPRSLNSESPVLVSFQLSASCIDTSMHAAEIMTAKTHISCQVSHAQWAAAEMPALKEKMHQFTGV